MRVLTDDPLVAGIFVPDGHADGWRRDGTSITADRELIDGLGGAAVWRRDDPPLHPFWSHLIVLSHSEVSQFDALTAILGRGTRWDGAVASIALTGRRFHGHRGRYWAAARGNLHVSVAVPVALDLAHVGVGLSMLPCVAVVDAIDGVTGGAITLDIKWVNDIVIRGRKVGGVLTTAQMTGTRIDGVVWGIGINVEVAPDIVPTPFVPAATCLHAEPGGAHITVPRLFHALLDAIARRFAELSRGGAAALFPAYRDRSLVIGRNVQVWDESACAGPHSTPAGRPFAEGVVADIFVDLSLRLEGRPGLVTKGRLAMRAT